jgi:hypothetical protein
MTTIDAQGRCAHIFKGAGGGTRTLEVLRHEISYPRNGS